ncbi:MAG: hypothetical protein Q9180_006209, partial [Flavoplaca navasiana]
LALDGILTETIDPQGGEENDDDHDHDNDDDDDDDDEEHDEEHESPGPTTTGDTGIQDSITLDDKQNSFKGCELLTHSQNTIGATLRRKVREKLEAEEWIQLVCEIVAEGAHQQTAALGPVCRREMEPAANSSYKPSLTDRLLVKIFHVVNKFVVWHKLPGLLGAVNLEALRVELRQYNLHDGYASEAAQGNQTTDPLTDKRFETARNSDGKFNSTEMPRMGCAGMRFGRNFPRHLTPRPTEEQLWNPNPRMLSERFMARKEFIPATSLNLLAAAWIQFQTHDWFAHESHDKSYDIPLPEKDSWPHGKMELPRTKEDEVLDKTDLKCPGYKNTNTAWWDSSQIYGSSESATKALRNMHNDGKLLLTSDGRAQFLPRDADGNPLTGFNNNWWIGMEMLHTLFAMEHNSICDAIRNAHPTWTGDEVFDKARLVNCALMAKIHTVEWTPAILAHPALKIGMNANWWGLVGESLTKMLGRISRTSEVISGIPGSGVDHFSAPYSLTEEFVSVYRMHSLIPDSIAFHSATSGTHIRTMPVEETLFSKAQEPLNGSKNQDG